jgi:hypothetical protein
MGVETSELVWTRAGGRCEYCRIHQAQVELTHHIEHIVARKQGGSDNESNLCLACERCNLFKGSDLTGIDPATSEVERLFNPRTQAWAEHFALRGALIVGLTPTGRTTVRVLSMNAGQRLQLRAALIARDDVTAAQDGGQRLKQRDVDLSARGHKVQWRATMSNDPRYALQLTPHARI